MGLNPMTETNWSRLSELIADRMGLHFPPERWSDLQRGLTGAAEEFGFADVRLCVDWLLSAPLNFKVLVAPDGATALIQATENQKFLRVVITDMHMAGMDGLAFVRVLKQMLPETKIIVTSGRLDEFETADFKALGVSDMMAKPFTHEKLVKILQTTFTQQTPSESGHTQPKLAI